MVEESNSSAVKVQLKTNMGEITLELYPDMPITAGNFQKLVEKGFYDGTIFHRIIDGFMIQGGDPTGTGRGGPGYAIKDRFSCQWCIYDGPKQIAAIYKHNRPAYDECHALELQTNWTLSSDRKFLPEVLADYEASGKRWIPPTAIYTRNAICDY